MSASSLAAAKRRRGNIAQPNQSRPPSGQSRPPSGQNIPPSNENIPPNPMEILKQHHMKINLLEQQVEELFNSNNSENITTEQNNELNRDHKIDLSEITHVISSRIEEQLDFKVFYENDSRLANELEKINTVVLNQQNTINDLNKLLYFIINNLKLDYNPTKMENNNNEITLSINNPYINNLDGEKNEDDNGNDNDNGNGNDNNNIKEFTQDENNFDNLTQSLELDNPPVD